MRSPPISSSMTKGLITRQPVVDSQQRLVAIQSAIGRLQAEITQDDSQAFQTSWQPGELKKQRQLEIRDQEARLQSMRNRLRLISTVVAPVSGEVVEEKIYAGSLITAGAPVISIQPDNGQMIAVLYVPSMLAKDVHPGMDAEISPSTAKREEYRIHPWQGDLRRALSRDDERDDDTCLKTTRWLHRFAAVAW